MGIFSSKKGILGRSEKDPKCAESKKKGGFRRLFSFMFATPESKQRKAVINVYDRPTFKKSLEYEPGKGYSSTNIDYATDLRCGRIKTTAIKRSAYKAYDYDKWCASEIREYDEKFIPVKLDDETIDMMKMSVEGLEKDAMEIEEFGEFSEADIRYDETEIPMAKPAFLPEIIREEAKEEVVEEPVVEVPVVEPIVEEKVEETKVEETVEQPVQIEAPVIAGLIEEPKAAIVEEPIVEVAEPVVEEPKETNVFSFGFGTTGEAQAGSISISFGFGAEPEVKEETSSFIESSVFTTQGATKATSM